MAINDLISKNLRVLGLGLILAGCGAASGGSSEAGCKNDSDCKGNRICIDGECVEGSRNVPGKDTYSGADTSYNLDTSQNCTSHFKKVCSDGDLYWKDSCGNLENKIDSCNYGCSNGACNEPGSDAVSWNDTASWEDSYIPDTIVYYDQEPSCTDECSDYGQTKCSGNGWKECGDYDSDSCLEWSDLNSCGSNEKCEGGECIQKSGTGSYCDPCGSDADCVEGMVCNGWNDNWGNAISTWCTSNSSCFSDDDCGGGYVCYLDFNTCVPATISLNCVGEDKVAAEDICGTSILLEECPSGCVESSNIVSCIINTFPSPVSASCGLDFDGQYLWECDQIFGTNKIYKLTLEGKVVDSFDNLPNTPDYPSIFGMTIAAPYNHLYLSGSEYGVGSGSVFELNLEGEIEKTFDYETNTYPRGIVFIAEENDFYGTDALGEIYPLTLADSGGKGVASKWEEKMLTFPGEPVLLDLAWDGTSLLTIDIDDQLYVVSVTDPDYVGQNKLQFVGKYDLIPLLGGTSSVGIAWDGENYWLAGLSQLYKVKLFTKE